MRWHLLTTTETEKPMDSSKLMDSPTSMQMNLD